MTETRRDIREALSKINDAEVHYEYERRKQGSDVLDWLAVLIILGLVVFLGTQVVVVFLS